MKEKDINVADVVLAMALDDLLEEHAPTQPQGLETRVGFRNIFSHLSWKDYTILGGFTLASTLVAGPVMALGGFAAYMAVYGFVQKRNKLPLTKKGVVAEGIMAALNTSWLSVGYHYFNKLSSLLLKGLVGFTIGIPLSFGIYFPLKHLLHNYSFTGFFSNTYQALKGAYRSLKANFWNAYKKTVMYIGLPLLAFWGMVAESLQGVYHAIFGRIAGAFAKYQYDKDVDRLALAQEGMQGR